MMAECVCGCTAMLARMYVGNWAEHFKRILHEAHGGVAGADMALHEQDMMKALMCFMYELAPPVWQRLVCCKP